MNSNFLEFGLPLWWFFPAALFAFGLSIILYKKKGLPWSKNQNLILGSLRFLAVLLILLLLLNPFIKQIINEVERPLVVVGLDNSSSIASIHDENSQRIIIESVENLLDRLESEKNYQVEFVSLQGAQDSLSFDDSTTDYSGFFRFVENEHADRNLAAVILASDGIHNRGSSPAFRTYNYPLFTLGLGDTIPQRDVIITEIRNNDVAYSGNEFPVKVKISGQGFGGQPFEIKVMEGANVLEIESSTISNNGNEFTFFITADAPGIKQYTFSVTQFEGEVTLLNNKREVFVEILESKKQILIAANSPHPDIRAIRSVLEETGNYEVTVFIERMTDTPDNRKFDMQILMDGVNPFPDAKSGIWIINSDILGADLKEIPFLNIEVKGQPDNVTPSYNSNFSKFKLTQELDRFYAYPPISVPFGDYSLSGPYEVLLYQQVGSVITKNPLIVVFDNGDQRQAALVGQGIWQWRLQEAANNGEASLFTEMIQKMVQYLSISESKKRFRVTKEREIFTDGEVVSFDVEIYNDIFQSVEGQPYALEISGESEEVSRFDFVFGSESKVAHTTSFAPGTYSYVARTKIGEESLIERGEFVVNALQLEQLQLTANHDLLKQISTKSGGKYFHLSQRNALRDELLQTDFKGIIHSDNDRTPLINSFWVICVIVGLLSVEWGLRKFWGGY